MRRMKKLKDMLARVRRESKGFTLVELIVVIAILGILTAIAVPTYSGYVKKANTAADQTLLDSINSAFASACISNGVNVYEVATNEAQIEIDDATGEWADTVAMAHNGIDLVEDFKAYMGGDETAFRVVRGLYYNTTKGMFETTESEGGYNYLASDVNAWKGGTLGQNMTSSELLDLVDTSMSQVAGIYGDTYFASATGAQSFKDAAQAMMGIDNYDEYIEEQRQAAYDDWFVQNNITPPGSRDNRNAANAYADGKVTSLKTNMMVAVSAKNAQAAGSDILTILKKGDAGKTEIKNNVNGDSTAAMGVSQAALAYGLYASYAETQGKTANVADFATALSGVDPDFNSYLNGTLSGTDVNKDLAGLMGAMNTIGMQNSGTIGSAVSNGFNNSDLAAALEQILGK